MICHLFFLLLCNGLNEYMFQGNRPKISSIGNKLGTALTNLDVTFYVEKLTSKR